MRGRFIRSKISGLHMLECKVISGYYSALSETKNLLFLQKESTNMSLREKVEEVIEKDIRPALMRDGGNIAVVDVDESSGTVKVQLLGACGGCPMSMITLTSFVERYLRAKVPEVKKIIPV